MASRRSYRSSLTKEKIVEEVINNKGTQFDPNLTLAFLEMIKDNEKNIKEKIYTDAVTDTKPKTLI